MGTVTAATEDSWILTLPASEHTFPRPRSIRWQHRTRYTSARQQVPPRAPSSPCSPRGPCVATSWRAPPGPCTQTSWHTRTDSLRQREQDLLRACWQIPCFLICYILNWTLSLL